MFHLKILPRSEAELFALTNRSAPRPKPINIDDETPKIAPLRCTTAWIKF